MAVAVAMVAILSCGAVVVASEAVGRSQPQALHLALGNSADAYVVSWLTLDETRTSTVKYGTAPGALDKIATGSARIYDHVGGGFNHFVTLDALPANAKIYYLVGDAEGGFSDVFFFETRRAEAGKAPMTFAIYGDLGLDKGEPSIAAINSHGAQGEYDFVLHLGDISYANDAIISHNSTHDYEEIWRDWFAALAPTMTRTPYMVMPGNHESWSRSPLSGIQTFNFTVYKYKFQMPGAAAGSDTSMFYSFDYGLVHFIALSTETDYDGHPIDFYVKQYKQVNWLRADLAKAAANRANVPWIIVMGHRPVYCTGSPYSKDSVPTENSATLQAWLEPLFKEYRVDAYVSGHAHRYERQFPTYRNQPTSRSYTAPGGTVYLVSGGAGNVEGHSSGGADAVWTAYKNITDFGYSTMTVVNATHLEWQWRVSATDELADAITIVSDHDW
ncbi:uncharacterized protein AMSG_01167 [Thecamonas trahens ATCC 50062]|uniref:Purple acid phosphatase n=1 Tax=Thecamonas trahens ATCC 50062 TaxID=461836 RepID=A0A0L0DMA7_THETB|nr:hypothetical protein AMSG_01167 [Thecamonas trahens ATCC 50062]KNC53454.1 hypothetical protein AMSG_01167 [Thecamonas trahens ATCC 50062]|eukprot:XP_013761778.1 hypothetical protein AMSG_01167 [Thecamonas trahens ATCC 50062]